MRNNYFFLLPLLIFSSVFSCDLPEDLYKPLIMHALKGNIRFVKVLKQLSTKFYAIINDPEVMKEIIARNVVGQARCSSWCAKIIATQESLTYNKVNRELMREDDIDIYCKRLRTEPYADVNYQEGFCTKLQRQFWERCYKKEKRAAWAMALLNNGANFHHQLDCHGRTTLKDAVGVSIGFPFYQYERVDTLYTLEAFFKHNAQIEKKYIETKHLCIDEVIKQKREDYYNDERPFMTWSVDYLTLIAKYGFNIKTVCPHPLHYHLYNNPDLAPVMVQYLVQEHNCDPYEMVDMCDGSEPESPYTIVTRISDESLKQELLTIFKTAKKQI